MRFEEVLRTFAEYFEREGIRYVIAGGLAIHAWGYSRTTYDIDFAVDGSARDRVIAFAEAIGYETRHASEGYSNHDHPEEAFGSVDLIYLYDQTAERIFGGSSARFIAGEVQVPVPKPEHLIALKVQAIKNAPKRVFHDVPDIEFLLRLPGIDHAAVRDYFDRAGLLSIYDAIQKEA